MDPEVEAPAPGLSPTERDRLRASFAEWRPDFEIEGYELGAELGRGGMAVVYEARQVSLGRKVAIKFQAPFLGANVEFAKRFEREARALAALDHPHIVSVIELGNMGDQPYFVMEYVEGSSLRDLLEEAGGRLTQDWALFLFLQIAEGLQYLHRRGVFHRDIKPDNILVNEDGVAKITDFGLVTGTDPRIYTILTMPMSQMGTPDYMAPEQRIDASSTDHRADIYAFGISLYEALVGTTPKGAWRPPSKHDPSIDPRFDALIESCLAPDPRERIPQMSIALADLRLIQAGEAEAATDVPPPVPEDSEVPEADLRTAEAPKPRRARPPPPAPGAAGFPWTTWALVVLVLGGAYWAHLEGLLPGDSGPAPPGRRATAPGRTRVNGALAAARAELYASASEKPGTELALDPGDRAAILAALQSPHPGDVVGALELARAGKARFSATFLEEFLAQEVRSWPRRVACELLVELGSPEAWAALERAARASAPLGADALVLLFAEGRRIELPPEVQEDYLLRAATGGPGDEEALQAVRALAVIAGEPSLRVLDQLASQASPPIRETAIAAMGFRVEAGIPPLPSPDSP